MRQSDIDFHNGRFRPTSTKWPILPFLMGSSAISMHILFNHGVRLFRTRSSFLVERIRKHSLHATSTGKGQEGTSPEKNG